MQQIGRQHRRHRQRHDQRRDGQGDIRHPHDDNLGPAAEIARSHAQNCADRNGDAQHHHRQQQGYPQAKDHPCENVPPDIVGAEPIHRRWRQVPPAKIGDGPHMVGKGRDIGRKNRRQHTDHHNHQPDHRRGVALKAVPVLIGIGQGGIAHLLPLIRTRGSTKPTSTSIARLTSTKNTPDTMTTPITALRSFCRMVRMP